MLTFFVFSGSCEGLVSRGNSFSLDLVHAPLEDAFPSEDKVKVYRWKVGGVEVFFVVKKKFASNIIKIRLLINVFASRTLRMAQKSFTTKPKGHLRKRTSRSEMMAESLSSMLKLTKHALPY